MYVYIEVEGEAVDVCRIQWTLVKLSLITSTFRSYQVELNKTIDKMFLFILKLWSVICKKFMMMSVVLVFFILYFQDVIPFVCRFLPVFLSVSLSCSLSLSLSCSLFLSVSLSLCAVTDSLLALSACSWCFQTLLRFSCKWMETEIELNENEIFLRNRFSQKPFS